MDSNDSSESSIGAARSSLPLPPKTLIGFLLAVVAVAIIALLSYQSLQATAASAANLSQTIEVLGRLEGLLSTLKDAETGQRGFLLTGEENYLAPYTCAKDALPGELKATRALLAGWPEQQRRSSMRSNLWRRSRWRSWSPPSSRVVRGKPDAGPGHRSPHRSR
jgi:CHASE3 domain sensor protein